MKRNLQTHQRGIIGWVLALMLAGLALAMLTPFVMGQHKRSAEDTDRAALEAARTAVVAYAMTHGKLPTPVPDTKDPKRCPNGILPADLGVNNWGRYGATNPFCLDTNVTLSSTSNLKALCAAARSELATPSLPYVCNNAAGIVDSDCTGSRSAVAFVIYSTGNDRGGNRKHDLLLNPSFSTPLGHVYENDFHGIDDSPGTSHYDDQVLSYPLASLVAECGKAGGPGSIPICQLNATPTPFNSTVVPISLGVSSTLTGSCSTAPKPGVVYPQGTCPTPQPTWTVLENGAAATHAATPTATFDGVTPTVSAVVKPSAPGTYKYTLSATCNEFGPSPVAPAVTATVIVTAPVCTLTPSPATITTTGGSSTLTLSCDVAPTAYSWSGGYGTASCSGATCVVTPPATQLFGVTPTFGTAPNTWTPSSAVTATVAVVPSCATPVCTPSASPTTITSGNSSTLSANCSVTPDAPLTYLWSPACSTSATCSVSPTTTTAYSVTATSGACSSVAAATTVTVGASTPALPALPAGYVVQGGLTWTPNNIGAATLNNRGTATWTVADYFCRNGTLNDQTGWRLPTITELKSLYTSGAINGQGWKLHYDWSSTPRGAGYHEWINYADGRSSWSKDTMNYNVTCVRYAVGADTPASLPAGYVVQGGLTWTPNSIGAATWNNAEYDGTATWTVADYFCRNGTFNDQTGWRLPTITELTSLYKSGANNGQGWKLYLDWSSTPHGAGYHERINYVGGVSYSDDTNNYSVTCVR